MVTIRSLGVGLPVICFSFFMKNLNSLSKYCWIWFYSWWCGSWDAGRAVQAAWFAGRPKYQDCSWWKSSSIFSFSCWRVSSSPLSSSNCLYCLPSPSPPAQCEYSHVIFPHGPSALQIIFQVRTKCGWINDFLWVCVWFLLVYVTFSWFISRVIIHWFVFWRWSTI